jgi:glutamate:Na+ symporter, ESS family
MNPWDYPLSIGDIFLDFGIIGGVLLMATLIRRYVPIVQQSLIPNNILAGLIALGLGTLFSDFINQEHMGLYVYHLLGLTFIAVAMSKPKAASGMSPVHTGMLFIATYLVQGIIGMVITFALIFTIMPDLYPGFGLLIPLGFGMGPGIAYSVGSNWESYGFVSGGIAGLSIAAVGFSFAYIHGIFWMRKGIKAGLTSLIPKDQALSRELLTGLLPTSNRPIMGRHTTASEAIESLSLHWSMVGLVYALTWLLLSGVASVLLQLGAESELSTLWSFHFIFCSVIGIFVRALIDRFDMDHHIDEGIMSSTGNLFVDVMITASLAGISLAVVGEYWIPLLLCGVLGGVATYFFIKNVSRFVFKTWNFERMLAAYAVMTGTIQSGLVLLRVLDPKYESPVSIDLVYASGFALVFGFPLLILINAPMTFFEDSLTGYVYTLFGMMAYALLIAAGWLLLYHKDDKDRASN